MRTNSIRRRLALAAVAAALSVVAAAGPALACAGLVTPGGNIRLLRTATLAAWADGYEHYVTSFTFQGGGAEFGSIVPLPGIPSKVERGGDWTLQRLERETQPQPARATADECANCAAAPAEEVYSTRIDALDITILRGGGEAVGQWAKEHGFSLTPDAPEVLDFYAARSPIFMAARFDAEAARERGQENGEGTPIHLTIPLDDPWVPLRILGLGRASEEFIDADVYLLTPDRPALLPEPGQTADGLVPLRSEAASKSLLDDLRSDQGMEWIPEEMWLTYLRVAEEQAELRYDLAVNTSGGKPSPVMAGLASPPAPETTTTTAAPTTTSTAAPTSTTVTTEPKPAPSVRATPAAPAPEEVPAPADAEPAATDTGTGTGEPAEVPPAGDEILAATAEPDVAIPVLTTGDGAGQGAGRAAVAAAVVGAGLGAGAVAAALAWRVRRRGSDA